MRFKVLGGTHNEDEITYKKGEVVESYENLVEMFPNKFQRLPDEEPPSTPAPAMPVPQAPAPVAKPVEPLAPLADHDKADRGRDVTAQFPRAVDEDYRVFLRPGGRYFVYDTDDLSAAKNGQPLKKSEVEDFIKKQLEG